MPIYLLRVSLDHLSFRLPSLISIGDLYGFSINFLSEDTSRAGLVIELEHESHLQHILDRGVLVISAIELLAKGTSYDILHDQLRAKITDVAHGEGKSWRFTFESVNHHVPHKRQLEVIKSFPYLDFKGPIQVKDPDVEYVILEDCELVALKRDGKFRYVFFGRRAGHSRARPLIVSQSIKTRKYYGTTTMEAEMGLLMAGQTLPAPGKIIYDPFVGTGSALYGCAHWGAYVMGSDIDGRQMRGRRKGKGVTSGILENADQYGLSDQILDLLTFDVTRAPLRRGGWVDAIITDPPYGVRAGAKRQGKRNPEKRPVAEQPVLLEDGSYSHKNETYVPPFRPYELTDLTVDLVLLARYLLVPKGRLVFFLPTVTEDYDEVDIPLVEGMREIRIGDGSVQSFGKWGRRLITMEKIAEDDGPPPTFENHGVSNDKVPGHYQFNRRFFQGFASR
ncbi:hypothetical protein M231_02015 [Tremella mesenterica]|uniref:tRNA (guanine(10)-N(2))-methyltransferase n=1 Tax=Tremella mesenterica TaxID=5217 RepID=A0A4Q1BRZ9_TREME|nr:hypothetical protein M231_02015 [Tremella mesenterica]